MWRHRYLSGPLVCLTTEKQSVIALMLCSTGCHKPFMYLRDSWSGTGAHRVSFQWKCPEFHTTAQIPQLSQIFNLVLLQIQQLQILQQTDWTQIWDAVEGHVQLLSKNQEHLWPGLQRGWNISGTFPENFHGNFISGILKIFQVGNFTEIYGKLF